jgi:hypothetical protein
MSIEIHQEAYFYRVIHENGHVLYLSGKPGDDRSDSKNVFSPQPTKIHHAMAQQRCTRSYHSNLL